MAATAPITFSELVCPDCKQALEAGSQELACRACAKRWTIEDGVACFTDSAPYWGESGIPQETARQIVTEMRTRDWHDVIRNHPEESTRKRYKFIADLSRVRWHEYLKLSPSTVALDLGAGLGTASQALSQRCKRVYSVERVMERVEFMKLRFQQERCQNITLVRSDADHLPFRNDFFDLVVLNGVLEWLPYSRTNENPRDVQLHYLRTALRLLKPGGTLYLGIENRTSYSYFTGGLDPHANLPYVAILPRWAADIVCKIKTGDRYRPYLYSHKGYRKLLKEAGFSSVDMYAAIPSYSNPVKMVPIDHHSREFVDDFWQTKNLVSSAMKNLMVRMDRLKYWGHAYVMFARK